MEGWIMFGSKTGRKATLLGLALILAGPVAGQEKAGPYRYRTLTPCRVFDTRDTAGGMFPLRNPGPHGFDIRGICGVPTAAVAVAVNVTITQPTQAGDLRIFPSGGTQPLVSTMNFAAGEAALANGAIVPLGAGDYDIQIAIGMAGTPYSGSVHVLLDVAGYFQ
jgi:hypothetical protein